MFWQDSASTHWHNILSQLISTADQSEHSILSSDQWLTNQSWDWSGRAWLVSVLRWFCEDSEISTQTERTDCFRTLYNDFCLSSLISSSQLISTWLLTKIEMSCLFTITQQIISCFKKIFLSTWSTQNSANIFSGQIRFEAIRGVIQYWELHYS